jgi:hypothetical protein
MVDWGVVREKEGESLIPWFSIEMRERIVEMRRILR